MKSAVKPWLLLAATMLAPAAHAQAGGLGPEGDYPVTIGDPYTIGGVTYAPIDTLNYDAVGYAHAGGGSGISGAHHTLPVPCYVEVTSLDSGRTILVRIDRRGPMDGKQLVELSPDAWAQLGLPAGADAAVRVRRVNPPEPERAALRKGTRAPLRMDTPPGLLAALKRKLGVATGTTPDEPPSMTLAGAPVRPAAPAVTALPPAPKPAPPPAVAATKPPAAPATAPARPTPKAAEPVKVAEPKPAPKPVPKPAEPKAPEPKPSAKPDHWTVQVAAFGERAHAEKAAAQVGGKVEPVGKLWRVRIPADSADQARAALAKAKQAGYAGALLLHHD